MTANVVQSDTPQPTQLETQVNNPTLAFAIYGVALGILIPALAHASFRYYAMAVPVLGFGGYLLGKQITSDRTKAILAQKLQPNTYIGSIASVPSLF